MAHAPNRKTGSLQWQFDVSGLAYFAPDWRDDLLYVRGQRVTAVTADGDCHWTAELHAAASTPPAVSADTVSVVGGGSESSSEGRGTGVDGSRLYALDAETGRRRWQVELPGTADTSPVYLDDLICVASGSRLFALDAHTGDVQFRFPVDGTIHDIVTDRNIIYVAADSGYVYALRVA